MAQGAQPFPLQESVDVYSNRHWQRVAGLFSDDGWDQLLGAGMASCPVAALIVARTASAQADVGFMRDSNLGAASDDSGCVGLGADDAGPWHIPDA